MSIVPVSSTHLLPLATTSACFSSLELPPRTLRAGSHDDPVRRLARLGFPGRRKGAPPLLQKWLCGNKRRDRDPSSSGYGDESEMRLIGSEDDFGTQIPTQVQSLVEGSGSVMVSQIKPIPEVDYIQELLAIQQQGPRSIGFFGTRNMGFMHQELIEILSYAMVITKNHIYTSGASGTNAAVIRGALRAEKPELLTVILPQSLQKQPPESQELLAKVKYVIEKPHNDHLPLIEASRLCNMDIISQVQQVICFAFHDSKLLMETCQEAKNLRKIEKKRFFGYNGENIGLVDLPGRSGIYYSSDQTLIKCPRG